MANFGEYNIMKVIKEKSMGVFLDDGHEGILLPKRFVPPGTKTGDELKVFLYHDGEERPIATTQKPYGVLGDIVKLKVVSVNNQGAFLDWGLMKDLFIPKSKMKNYMIPNGEYLVKIVMDEKTGRLAATEKLEPFLSNENLTVEEKDLVDLVVYRKTDIGYEVIINNIHKGILHNNEIYRNISIGDKFKGFIKKVFTDKSGNTLIDVAAGKSGYERVEDETEKILRLLKESDGYLPYHDKSSPEEIYSFFSMSKKTFKMATGNLYKQHRISFTQTGIQLIEK
ncbi:MAG TPA: S1-like domain-containing RNA-binding protein [Hanamia sp.]|nr:S1-like domain-containing RNA-binding protein [Hanamia sp.]